MAEILKIENNQVKIGTDAGKVITVPIATLNFSNPQPGDKVKVYQDGKDYIIQKDDSSTIYKDSGKGKQINKHVFVWVGAFLFGGFGVDRFLRGQIGVGICKILFGWLTLGIWSLVDWVIAIVKAYGSSYSNTEFLTFDEKGHYTE
ncbi:TM2 domain-containing protein [Candidatus Saccharibacteria bacterium]|nr:TM2 domain-containing protein [Candidatus Saccharibacteria bacterium]